ncbi:MAG: HAD family hydrolase [Caldiserica bacterium]|nr:HAD family hydrolase [Caldisericota bacterium]MDH7561772.1 HAD family hydrolase [Caldisericota bacterium]
MDSLKLVPASIELLAFDWDGTLLNSKEATLQAYRVIFSEAGIPLRLEDVFKYYSPNWYRTYKALGLPEELFEWADNRWLEIYRDCPRTLMDGALEVLEWLKRKGFLLALLSAANRNRLEDELKVFNLEGFFSRVVCMEDFGTRKPDPLPLESLIKSLKVSFKRAAYIGDSPEDIEMGKRAGVFTVGIPGPYVSREILKASNPSLFLENIKELKEVFNGKIKSILEIEGEP